MHIKPLRGVTLIELLVVIAIMGTMLSLVAPLAINTVQKTQAQSEYVGLASWLKKVSYRGFASGMALTLNAAGERVWFTHDDEVLYQRHFDHLVFPNQQVRFNRNGIPQQSTLRLLRGDQPRQLDLLAMTAGRNSGQKTIKPNSNEATR